MRAVGLIEQAVSPGQVVAADDVHRGAGPRGLAAVTAEAQLARSAGTGDPDAFELLVDRHGPSMLRWAGALLPRADAENCVREAFLAVWRATSPYDGETSVRTWLFTLVRRAADAYPSRPLDAAHDARANSHGDRQDHLRHTLQGSLDRLPPAQRCAWMLREVERLSQRDVATVLGTDRRTVRDLLRRSRTTLSDDLSRRCGAHTRP